MKCWAWIKKWFRRLFIENTPLQGYVAHIPIGAFIVVAYERGDPLIAILVCSLFVIFEIAQQYNVGDQCHQDLAGVILGIVLTKVGYWIWG